MKYHFFKQLFRKFVYFPAVFALAALLFSCAGTAKNVVFADLGTAKDPVPFMEKARTGVLPSGLRYYLLENAKPEGRAFLTLAVNAGSVLETDEERGLAHFVEHMAFNGTARFPESELVDYLRSLGMRFGPEVNAYTSFDETVYGIEVPVETGPEGRGIIPGTALAVLDDWTRAVTFDTKSVDDERLVIMEEYRARLGAAERIYRETLPLLFRGSPYASRLPIGLPEVIEKAPVERLEAFYKKWYRPENMAVIIVGDFDAAFLESSLAEHFPGRPAADVSTAASAGTTIPGTTSPSTTAGANTAASGVSGATGTTAVSAAGEPFKRPRYDLSEPEKGSIHTLVLTDSELSRSRVDLYWKRTAEPRRDDLAYYREGVINYMTSLMLSLRFEEAAAKPETPYVYSGAGTVNYGYSSRFYVLVSQAKTASARESLKALLLLKESLSRYGFTQNEVQSAKDSVLSYLEQQVSEKDSQPSTQYIELFTRHFLEGETVPDIEWELAAVTKLLPGITRDEINAAVKNYFSDDDLTVIISAPEAEKNSLPDDAEIRALAVEVRAAEIMPPEENTAGGELLESVPAAGTIASETIDPETGAVRVLLDNGAEVILKETNNKNSEVTLYALARGGALSAPDETAVSAALATEMLNVSGLGSYSRAELTKMLLDKQVSLSFWTENQLRGFQGSAAVKDIKVLFEMLYLSFTSPRFDPGAITALMDQLRSSMAFKENDPDSVFNREISRTVYGNPRFHPLELADLEKANPEDAAAFIRSCLNPADYTFVFTGNIDLPRLRSLAETYLASIPRGQPFGELAAMDPKRPPDTEREIFRGKEERSAVYMGWFKPLSYSEEKSAAVSVLSEYLDICLTEKIRESLGGVYSVSTWASLSVIPRDELSGGVYFVCDPRRAEELSAAVKDEIAKIAGGDVGADIFEKAVEALVKGQEESVQSNLYIAQSYANSAVIFHSPLSRLDKRPALYRTVSPGSIARAAAELLEGSNIRLILHPETGR